MQKKNSSICYLISACFILCALLASVHFWSFNLDFYRKQHDSIMLYGKHISEYIGFSDEDLADLTEFTLDYLNDPDATLDRKMEIKGSLREVYTDDEKLHMVDVRKLNLAANCLCIASFVIVVLGIFWMILKKQPLSDLHKAYSRVLKIIMIVITVLAVWIVIDFDSFWTAFHHVFFASNELWILDLRKDILIMIVPPEFFNNLVIYIVITFVILVMAFYLVLHIVGKKSQ